MTTADVGGAMTEAQRPAIEYNNREMFFAWLLRHNACETAVAWAEAQINFRTAVDTCPDDGWLVWLVVHAAGLVEAEYGRIEGPARAEYERKRDPARAEYERKKGLARAEYERIRGPAWAEYERMRAQALRAALTWERVVEAIKEDK